MLPLSPRKGAKKEKGVLSQTGSLEVKSHLEDLRAQTKRRKPPAPRAPPVDRGGATTAGPSSMFAAGLSDQEDSGTEDTQANPISEENVHDRLDDTVDIVTLHTSGAVRIRFATHHVEPHGSVWATSPKPVEKACLSLRELAGNHGGWPPRCDPRMWMPFCEDLTDESMSLVEAVHFFFSPERLYREHRDAFELPEEIFWKQYRLPKIVVRWLCDEPREEPEVVRVRTSWTVMTVELQVLCALRFYGTGTFQGMVASDEHVARDQKTVSVAVRAVSVAIVRRLGVQRGWIHFPEKPSERFDAEKGFRLFGRIPGVISCVDGTMVSIVGPSKNDPTVTKAAYWCRKYFYALNVMVVSTPGSVLPPFNSHRHYFGMCSAPLHLPCIERARTGVRLRP
ncbi:putative nuclease HARBI1 isoform X2 [Ixodes scapularis]